MLVSVVVMGVGPPATALGVASAASAGPRRRLAAGSAIRRAADVARSSLSGATAAWPQPLRVRSSSLGHPVERATSHGGQTA